LDRIYEYGAMKVFSAISVRTLNCFNIDRSHVSFDTTSVSVQGDYFLYSGENNANHVPCPGFSLTQGACLEGIPEFPFLDNRLDIQWDTIPKNVTR
jgi:hypothetical protein